MKGEQVNAVLDSAIGPCYLVADHSSQVVESKSSMGGDSAPGNVCMLSQIEIKNFRCFRSFKQTGLKTFNFIVGESGSGKTALLEAMFLGGGASPEIWFRMRRWRGLGESQMEVSTRESYESLFRDMFYGFNQRKGLNIKLLDSQSGERKLHVYYEGYSTYSLPVKGDAKQNAFSFDPVIFKWEHAGKVNRSKVEIREGALRMTGSGEVYPIFLLSTQTYSAKLYAQYYSNLSRRRAEGAILDAVKSIFPNVEALSLEIIAGEPVLHASVQGMDEKLPLGDLSGGLSKYVSILISILTNKGGVVLVDEIENGFYHKNVPELLGSIMRTCEQYDVQLFATTHSYEFLQVASNAIQSSEERTRNTALFRISRDTEQPFVEEISGLAFEAAIRQNSEVR
jgi:ABC-type lipoprotein export system ATPase subunit